MDTDTLSKGKILITGASGFVGRNLYETLKKIGYNVVGIKHSKNIPGLIKCYLTEHKQTTDILKDIDYIFMVATKTYGAATCTKNPCAIVREGIIMNVNLLDACYKKGVKKVLFISSSVVYQHSFKPLAEEDLDLNQVPFHLYMGVGWVKRYTEQLCKFYDQLGMDVNIVRPTNIYGKYDKLEEEKSHFVPAIIQRVIRRNSPFMVWGSGNNLKDLIYIDDFVRDILLVFKRHTGVDPINVCSGELHSIRDIVKDILDIGRHRVSPIYDTTKPDSVPYKCLIKNKFNSLFGKQDYVPLRKGLARTYNWYIDFISCSKR